MAENSPSRAGGVGSIPAQGAEIPHALKPKQNKKTQQKHIVMNLIKTEENKGPHKKNLKENKKITVIGDLSPKQAIQSEK